MSGFYNYVYVEGGIDLISSVTPSEKHFLKFPQPLLQSFSTLQPCLIFFVALVNVISNLIYEFAYLVYSASLLL